MKNPLHEIIRHQREAHDYQFLTTYESAEASPPSSTHATGHRLSEYNPTSAIGCFGSDPYAYLLNLHWDQQNTASVRKTCPSCGETMTRAKFRRHCMTCKLTAPEQQSDQDDRQSKVNTVVNGDQDDGEGEKTDEEIIIFSARTDLNDPKENCGDKNAVKKEIFETTSTTLRKE